MSQSRTIQVVGALLLILVGVLALLDQFQIAAGLSSIVWGVLFLGGGAALLVGYAADRSQWWPLIPGFGLVGLGLLVLLTTLKLVSGEVGAALFFLSLTVGFGAVYLVRRRENWWAIIPGGALALLALMILVASTGRGELGAAVFFLGLGLAFVAVYFAEIDGHRQNWWALIPAGALLSLALVILLASLGSGAAAGASLFVGMGATFGVLYLMRSADRPLGWARYPAVACLVFGAFVFVVAGGFPYAWVLWPAALIGAGLWLLFRRP